MRILFVFQMQFRRLLCGLQEARSLGLYSSMSKFVSEVDGAVGRLSWRELLPTVL